jgi:hypothetical protein
VLSLAAIAEEPERIPFPTPYGERIFHRAAGPDYTVFAISASVHNFGQPAVSKPIARIEDWLGRVTSWAH